MNKITLPMLFVLLILPFSPAAAVIIDPTNIISGAIHDQVGQLELQSKKIVIVAAIPESGNPFEDGSKLLEDHQGDILLLYRYEEHKFAILQPIDKWVSDKEVFQVVSKYDDEKIKAISIDQKNQYLQSILSELSPYLIKAKDTRDYCETIKDGYCDSKCPSTDLDCQCGDAICQIHETAITCAHDCRTTGKYCTVLRDGICDEHCRGDLDCSVQKIIEKAQYLNNKGIDYQTMAVVLFIILVILSGIFMYLVHQQTMAKTRKGKKK